MWECGGIAPGRRRRRGVERGHGEKSARYRAAECEVVMRCGVEAGFGGMVAADEGGWAWDCTGSVRLGYWRGGLGRLG